MVELDRDLAARLREHPTLKDKLTVIEADAMRFDFGTLMGERQTAPAHLRQPALQHLHPLIFHLCEFADRVEDMHFMLQRKWYCGCAQARSSKAYGRLSVMVPILLPGDPGAGSGPGAFKPAPKSVGRGATGATQNPTIVAKTSAA